MASKTGTKQLFRLFSAVSLGAIFSALAFQSWYPLLAPFLLILCYLALVDFRALVLLLFACIPLSTDVNLPGGLNTDLPTEPLAVGLMLVAILYFVRQAGDREWAFVRHPLSLLLLLHWTWIATTALLSTQPVISLKFLLAKTWYLLAYFYLSGWVLTRKSDLYRWFWLVLGALLLTVFYVQIGHAGWGFSFEGIERVLHPFYSNHVIYAALLVAFIPFLWYMRLEYRHHSGWNRFFWFAIALMVVATYLSYTRAAYVALLSSLGFYLLLRLRLLVPAFILSGFLALGAFGWLAHRNSYLELAPNYETTISHREFDDLLQATYEFEDISTMERLYRWVAGAHMIGERPWTGFGPGAFYESYRPYTVRSFRTYVSDNPEQSGIHSYYLMTIVEQGLVGFLIFMLLQGACLWYAQRLYRRTRGWDRRVVLMATFCLTTIMVLQLINDLIETDKIGSLYFFSIALLVGVDLRLSGNLEEGADLKGSRDDPEAQKNEAKPDQ